MYRFLIVAIISLLAMPPLFGSRARAGEAPPKYELTRRVAEAAQMLVDRPRLRGMSQVQRERAVEFVVGNVLFVLAHEIGHAAISEMVIPVAGREEDAADIFAALMAILCSDVFADRLLPTAALGWFMSDRRDRRRGLKVAYYDEHGPDLQRAYTIVCLMVGSNITKFASVAQAAKMPAERQEGCMYDYLNASWSWEQLLKSHLRKPDQPKTAINVVYGPGNGKYNSYAQVSQRMQLLEGMAESLSDRYFWRAPISLEMQTCGSPNARWDFRNRKVIVCYELADEFSELYHLYGRTMAFSPGEKVSAPTPRGAYKQGRKAFRAERAPR